MLMDIGITLLHAGLWGRYEQDSFEYSVQNFVTVPQCKTDGQEGEEAARSSQPYSCPEVNFANRVVGSSSVFVTANQILPRGLECIPGCSSGQVNKVLQGLTLHLHLRDFSTCLPRHKIPFKVWRLLDRKQQLSWRRLNLSLSALLNITQGDRMGEDQYIHIQFYATIIP